MLKPSTWMKTKDEEAQQAKKDYETQLQTITTTHTTEIGTLHRELDVYKTQSVMEYDQLNTQLSAQCAIAEAAIESIEALSTQIAAIANEAEEDRETAEMNRQADEENQETRRDEHMKLYGQFIELQHTSEWTVEKLTYRLEFLEKELVGEFSVNKILPSLEDVFISSIENYDKEHS